VRLLDVLARPTRAWRITGWCALMIGTAAVTLLEISIWWVVGASYVVSIAPVVDDIVTEQRSRRIARERARLEPDHHWIVELDGRDIGELWRVSDAEGWSTCVVIGDAPRLFDEELWLHGRFGYRHAQSGRRPEHVYSGSTRPTREQPYVVLRGLG
jgi:hypothetical protein